jgi:hypothetical protein
VSPQDEEANSAGILTIIVFVIIVYVLRAVFSAADQTK